jgi:hypothetical protein
VRVLQRRSVLIVATGGLVFALAGCAAESPEPECRSEPRADPLSCQDAAKLGLGVAQANSVWPAEGHVAAYLHLQGVSEGHSVPAWFVEVLDPILQRGSEECPATEFTAVLDAATGRVLAHDNVECRSAPSSN